MKDHLSSKTTTCVKHRVVSQEGDYCTYTSYWKYQACEEHPFISLLMDRLTVTCNGVCVCVCVCVEKQANWGSNLYQIVNCQLSKINCDGLQSTGRSSGDSVRATDSQFLPYLIIHVTTCICIGRLLANPSLIIYLT